MPSPQMGPWNLAVKERGTDGFERFLASDGRRLSWVWRPGGEAQPLHLWENLRPPWLEAREVSRSEGGPALLSEPRSGVVLLDLLDELAGEGLPLGAAAALALAVAKGFEQLPDGLGREQVPLVMPDSLLIGTDGSVTLLPCHEGWVSAYLPAERVDPGLPAGWRVYPATLVLLHALDRHAPDLESRGLSSDPKATWLLRAENVARLPRALRPLVRRALGGDALKIPPIADLIAALTEHAAPAQLADLVARHFPEVSIEHRFDRLRAEGKDPEALPPDLVAAISKEATDESFNVLADWMLGEGLPRGELAAIQLKLEQGASLELTRAEATLLSRHRSLLPMELREGLHIWKPLWKAGWLTGLELKTVPRADVFSEILSHPTLRFLERLPVNPGGGHSQAVVDVLSSLELPALKRVELDGGLATHGQRLKRAKPQLRVESNKDHPPFPTRRRPEASVTAAKVGVGEREPAPGLPPLTRLIDWLSGDD